MGYDPDGDGRLNDPTGVDRFMNGTEVFFLTIAGVDPAVVNDEFLLSMAMRDYDAMQQRPREEIMSVFERQFELANRTDLSTEQKQVENRRLEQEIAAWTAMGNFTPDQLSSIISEVARRGGATWANMYYEFSTTTSRADPATLETRRGNLIEGQRPLPQIPPDTLRGMF
jgi:hypothetical protein